MKQQTAILAAGCFWGVQAYFDQVPGVIRTEVGYYGGPLKNPRYEDVVYGRDGRVVEATFVEFDSDKISYQDILRHFFRMHDPTQINGQGPDIGENYRSAIYYFDENQHKTAEQVKKMLEPMLKKPIVTEVESAKLDDFHKAEEYHQKYTEKTGMGACHVTYSELSKV